MAQPWVTGPAGIFVGGTPFLPTNSNTPQLTYNGAGQIATIGQGVGGSVGQGVSASFTSILQGGSTPYFFGHTEGTPDFKKRPYFEPVMSDLSGTKVPFDILLEGEDAIISGVFTRYNESVYAAMDSIGNLNPAFRGIEGTYERGSLMLAEGLAYPLYMQFPFSAKAAMAGLPPGYRLFAAYLIDNGMPSNGTRPKKLALSWHCMPVFYLTGSNQWTWNLCDNNLAALPPIN